MSPKVRPLLGDLAGCARVPVSDVVTLDTAAAPSAALPDVECDSQKVWPRLRRRAEMRKAKRWARSSYCRRAWFFLDFLTDCDLSLC